MKNKLLNKIAIFCISTVLMSSTVLAEEGEMGYFGGISSGVKLPTLTSLAQKKTTTTKKYTLPYKENIYLSGKAETVEGTIEIKPGKDIDKEKGSGSYTESYVIKAQNATNTARVSRTITFETQYTYNAELKQTTKVSTIKKWTENVTTGGKTYSLNSNKSSYTKSILEDYTPGVLYYRGDISYDAVYSEESSKEIRVSVNGPIYGYDQAFGKTETQKRSITVDLGDGQGYAIEETPTVTVYRDIQYGANEPTAISMAGNYKEITRGEGVLSYNILQGHPTLYDDELAGMINVDSTPTIEQLKVPTGLNLKGHPAESQINRMYGMKVFTDTPSNFSANQVVTRGEYIKMLVTALKMELPEDTTSKKKSTKKNTAVVSPFTDVKEGDAYYLYAMAAYNAGLIDGGKFNANASLTREMMYLLNIKAIGLERLGLGTMDAYTPFVDDAQISTWAKSAIYAASNLGIITPSNGYVFPQKKVTKAECATFLDQLINYLRYDLQKDYSDKMLMG